MRAAVLVQQSRLWGEAELTMPQVHGMYALAGLWKTILKF